MPEQCSSGPTKTLAAVHDVFPPSFVRAGLTLATAALLFGLGGVVALASPYQWFTDEAAFTAALDPNFYTATGSALQGGGGEVASPQTRSGASFGFTVTAVDGLYGLGALGRVLGVSPLLPGETLMFSAFTPSNQVRAFGGLFSATDADESRISGGLSLTLFSGTTLISGTTVSSASTATFLGLISSDVATPITRVHVGTPTPSAYATAETVFVGTPLVVPEPSMLAVAGVATVAIGIACRRRWRGSRSDAAAGLVSIPQVSAGASAMLSRPLRPRRGHMPTTPVTPTDP